MKVVLNGLSFDKKVFDKFLKSNPRDKDILSFIWGHIFRLPLYLIGCSIAILTLIFFSINEIFQGHWLTFPTILLIFFIFFILLHVKDIKSFFLKLTHHWHIIKLFWEKKEPWLPSDLSGIFLSNLSDSHALIPAMNLLEQIDDDNDIQYIFCGEPYFDTKYIDSILISFPNRYGKKYRLKSMYNKIRRNHAAETIESHLEGKEPYDKVNDRQIRSDYVFGIFFLSKYLYSLFNSEKKESKDNNYKIFYYFSDEMTEDQIKLEFARELISLAGDPEKIVERSTPDSCLIKIEDIFFKREGRKKPSRFSDKILIPVKRFLSLPKEFGEINNKMKGVPNRELIIPKIWAMGADGHKNDKLEIYCIGGAEHNFPLLHIIARHREVNKNNRNFGIMENNFDRSREFDVDQMHFKVGASLLVHGFNGAERKRDVNSTEAQLVCMKIDNYDIYCFYGYSAPMTRIAFLKFLYARIFNDRQYIPEVNNHKVYFIDEHKETGNHNEKINILHTKFLADWDYCDCMNNPFDCIGLLQNIKVKN